MREHSLCHQPALITPCVVGSCSVTNDTSVESGAFVDAQGQLDVSRVQTAGSQLFACVGVDPVENSARTRIRVTSVDPQEGEK